MPKISVIVPIYKVEKYLMECIDSILNQTLRDIEVLLIDEGDMDACRCIIEHYEKTDSRVIGIHEKNGGYGPSCNKGFDRATGEYISIIESDDFIAPEMFEEMYNYAKNLNADVVKTPYYEYWEKTKTSDEVIKPCFWHDAVKNVPENKCFSIAEYPIFMGIHPSVWSCIYKKEYFDKYNVRFLEDKGAYVDHHFKAVSLLNTDKIVWLNKPYYYYRLSNANASAANFNLPVMIKRWNEFHKLMQENFPGKYETFAEYNFAEEFRNTFEKLLCDDFILSDNDLQLLTENLSFTTLEQIKNAKFIGKTRLKRMISLKKYPKKLEKYNRKSIKSGTVKILGIPALLVERIRAKTYACNLFNLLPLLKIKKRSCFTVVYLFKILPIISFKN